MDAPCCNHDCLQGRVCPRRVAAAPPPGPVQRMLAAVLRWRQVHAPHPARCAAPESPSKALVLIRDSASLSA